MATKEIKFNINEEVKVKLNDLGRKIYTDHIDKLNVFLTSIHGSNLSTSIKIDENGYTKFQLWDLMNLFGPYLEIGKSSMFTDNEIVFLTEDVE